MAEISKFFNAVLVDGKYDREYFASDFADYFRSVLSAGLLLDENEEYGLQVTLDSGLQTTVSVGKALIKGYHYENTTPLILTHNLPEVEHDRIDRVVLRLDLRNQNRYIKVFVKEGIPGVDPLPPKLQRDEYIYELGLAQVIVRANTASIDANDITDERALEDVCGIVQSLVTVPTSVFQQQFDAWFNSRKEYYESIMDDWQQGAQQEFNDWFASIKDILDGDVAANLASRIANLENDFTAHLADYTQFKNETNQNFTQLIKVKNNATILATGWVDDTTNSGYFIYEIIDEDITNDTVVDVNIHLADLDKASGVIPITNSSDGKVMLYADEQLTENIICDLKLVRQVM